MNRVNLWPKSADHVKFTEEYIMCTENHALIKNVNINAKHGFCTMTLQYRNIWALLSIKRSC